MRRFVRAVTIAAGLAAGLPALLLAAAGAPGAALRLWCRAGTCALGVRTRRKGPLPPSGSLVVSNHVGYLDILVLGAAVSGRFVAKSEIAGWPVVGAAARLVGTIFVERERPRTVHRLVEDFAQRLARGERILLFPEARVNPEGSGLQAFRSMLFESCLKSGRPCVPTALVYVKPADPRVWAWIDEPSLVRHLWRRVVPAGRITVELRFGEPLPPMPGEGRKAFAARVRREVLALLGASEQPSASREEANP